MRNFWFDYAILIVAYNIQVVNFKPQQLLATSIVGWACQFNFSW